LDPKPIDPMVLSHAAIDLSGNLFNPLKNGNSVPMHAPMTMVVH
jgi:hypothetical protein